MSVASIKAKLLNYSKKYGKNHQFTRSGCVAITKPMRELREEYLEELEAAAENW